MSPRLRSWAMTDRGAVRDHNEDACLDRPDLGLWAVADGAGGHYAGELASRTIVEALDAIGGGLSAASLLARVRLAIAEAHAALCQAAAQRGGNTLIASTVVVLLARDDHFACLWAGDSRAYLLRDGVLRQITRDHSLVQEMVDEGSLSAEAAEQHPQANVITRAVGDASEAMELDKVTGDLRRGDRFLLCSDGLSKTVPREELTAAMVEDAPAAALVRAALARQVNDNVTAIVVADAADG
jgi:serine/threonine-protein phosphatase Stp1